GRRQAVVEDVPGVTRDRVAYDAQWSGRRFTVVDTGGWAPDARDRAAAIAAQAEAAVQMADVVLFVVDAAGGATGGGAPVWSGLCRVLLGVLWGCGWARPPPRPAALFKLSPAGAKSRCCWSP